MKTRLIAGLLLAASALPACTQTLAPSTPAAAGFSADRLQQIKALQQQYVAQGQLAGGVLMIVHNGKIATYETFGNLDQQSGKPMPKDAIFRIYSMTKPIVTVAALTLYEQGKFSLLDPVSKFLPEFAKPMVQVLSTGADGKKSARLVPAERPITVMDLMRHTSGMNNAGPMDENGKPLADMARINALQLAEAIPELARVPLVHQPGTGFDYSPGPSVLGRLIEIWSGKPLQEYLDQVLFSPLHMPDTGFWVPEEKWNRLATLYDPAPDGKIVRVEGGPQESFKHRTPTVDGNSGSGGLVSTTMDYARFTQMLLNGGELDGARILSPKSIELMSADLLGDLPVYGGPVLPGYGFGLTVAVNRGPAKTATIGSAGEYYWEGAASSLFFVDPKEKLFTVYMIQKRRGIAISREYKRMVYGAMTR